MEQLTRALRAGGPGARSGRKLEALMDLGRLDEPRILPFLLGVLADNAEAEAVRIDVLIRLRDAALTPDERIRVAEAIRPLLADRSRAVGVRPPAAGEGGQRLLVDRVAERLGDHATLLVLDNLEHVAPAAAAVGELLTRSC